MIWRIRLVKNADERSGPLQLAGPFRDHEQIQAVLELAL